VGANDTQIDEYKKKLKLMEEELTVSRETNRAAHEKHQEALSRATRNLQATEEKLKAEVTRLNNELAMVKSSGMGANDTLMSKNYSKAGPAEKPKAAPLSDVIADEQKQKEKGKEKEREDKSKEREERERQDRQREERERQDKERDNRDQQDKQNQDSASKQRSAELEAKLKQISEQVHPSTSKCN
jgi:hypothetical protein